MKFLFLIALVVDPAVAFGQTAEETGDSWEGIGAYLDIAVFGDFTIGELGMSFAIILLTFVFRNILTKVFFAGLKSLAARTKAEYDDRLLDAFEKPVSWFILILGIFLAIGILPLELELQEFLNNIFRGLSMLLAFWAVLRVLDVVADVLIDITGRKDSNISAFIPLLRKATRVFVIVVGLVMVIDNLGFSVSGIIATLGIGGAAFAFAAKDTIANLYGSFALAMDRPFKVGDWIMIGNSVDGDVEEIGLRSTKVRTWPKTVLSIPNNILANEIINNWSRMPKRRVKQIVGVTYETSPEDIAGLVQDFRDILREDEGVNQEFILVNFIEFGASSLDILVYYFTKTTAWLEHMDVRERINLKIMRAVEARGSSIAFPTRTLYLEGDVARGMAGLVTDGNLPGDNGPVTPP